MIAYTCPLPNPPNPIAYQEYFLEFCQSVHDTGNVQRFIRNIIRIFQQPTKD
jgi:hypothetical protein